MRDRKRHNQWPAHTYTMNASNKSHQKSNLKNMIQPHKSRFSNYPKNFITSLPQLYNISTLTLQYLNTNLIASTSFQNNSLPHYFPPIISRYNSLSCCSIIQYRTPHFELSFLFSYLPSRRLCNTFLKKL